MITPLDTCCDHVSGMRMEITTEPVYKRDTNINVGSNIILKLCTAVNTIYPGKLMAPNNLLIYIRSDRIGVGLIVTGQTIDGVHIDIYNIIIK